MNNKELVDALSFLTKDELILLGDIISSTLVSKDVDIFYDAIQVLIKESEEEITVSADI